MASLPKLRSRHSGDEVAKGVDIDAILRDSDAPSAGDPDGDVVVAAFTDYDCPFCKAAARDLDKLVAEDGKVRLVHKDWPTLTDASLYGARLALAAKYQGRYEAVYRALMAIPDAKISKERMLAAVRASGVNLAKLQDDLHDHSGDSFGDVDCLSYESAWPMTNILRFLATLVSGTTFGLGLALSGMLDPVRVRDFLDITGNWDPSLAFVMAGAGAVTTAAVALSKRMKKPALGGAFQLPNTTQVDFRLIAGSLVFGIGWGMAGLCPDLPSRCCRPDRR